MNPYQYVKDAVKEDDTVLSLCAGIGLELFEVECKEITAVDIHQPHLDKLSETYPQVKTVCSDILSYLKKQKDNSFDVVSLIDGIEHLTKKDGLEALREAVRVCKREMLVFTPKGFVKNEPHNAWGIEGGDKYQTHKSGWEPEELAEFGFEILSQGPNHSQHGDLIQEMIYRLEKPSV
jgi:hypothetical protein